ncbi:hypothetical protein [Legionella cincinnatiensis]|uniref:Uncharacterized protein n=1 Tax=Legionella cincinnatiensis TaxID=28085 RepID=A0A378IN82_9GAMM|nr:hypothetical protein [Legionella cincinnatiensis]KTC93876.1 hypothetical protein Lcin_0106 [Legionella cincinnatiensis]STX36636.1 Uncharacterised protein [Legionella cincinnatiensis]
MSDEEMKRILLYCQILGFEGLRNGTYAIIPELKINFPQPNSFMGVRGNPAIFVTEVTYKKLKQFHEDWVPNITIAISHAYLIEPKRSNIDTIGMLVHEAGHAFNVYGKLKNNEANAYVFEIETMLKLLKMNILPRQFGLYKEDLQSYFKSRMEQYNLAIPSNSYLKTLVEEITNDFNLDGKDIKSESRVKFQIKLGFFKKNDTTEPTPERNLPNQPMVKVL